MMQKTMYTQWLPLALLLCLAMAAYDLWSQQQHAQVRLSNSQTEVQHIQTLAQRYTLIKGTNGPITRFSQNQAAANWLVTHAKQQGLTPKATPSNTAKQIQMNFEQAHFNRLVQWLEQAENKSNLIAVKADLKAHTNAGYIAGQITFEMN